MNPYRLLTTLCACVIAIGALAAAPGTAGAAGHAVSRTGKDLTVSWMRGVSAPGTPAKYDKVGVIKVGPRMAKNVLVLEPGTSAGGAYFVPLAKWIVAKAHGWQVWSVERRENLLEDQSMLNQAKAGKASPTAAFNYYLGWLADKSITPHFQFIPDSSVEFGKQWGMRVAVGDLHRVIEAAEKRGGRVVLGGHSLGGSVVTAYATWNFHGHSGASQLAGLVYIDGGSRPASSASDATTALQALDAPSASPWLAFGGITAPFAGLFNATGSLGALLDPDSPSIGQEFPDLPAYLKPSVRVTNLAQYGFALDTKTSVPALAAAQAHLGHIAAAGPVHGWVRAGAITPIKRFATMFSGLGVDDADGTEWYFPSRLTLDTTAVGNGIANPAQKVLGVSATMGRRLPHSLRIYAFDTSLGGPGVLAAARQLARQSHIPRSHLTLIDRHRTYAHNDPNSAFPHNAFFAHLVPYLATVATER
jgi:pimeloyl-ACP methyl ester carboxylesterase